VSDERGAGQAMRFGREVGILPRRYRLLVQLRLTVFAEDTDPGAVRVSPALFGQTVRSV
jgi:hypothetical protein